MLTTEQVFDRGTGDDERTVRSQVKRNAKVNEHPHLRVAMLLTSQQLKFGWGEDHKNPGCSNNVRTASALSVTGVCAQPRSRQMLPPPYCRSSVFARLPSVAVVGLIHIGFVELNSARGLTTAKPAQANSGVSLWIGK